MRSTAAETVRCEATSSVVPLSHGGASPAVCLLLWNAGSVVCTPTCIGRRHHVFCSAHAHALTRQPDHIVRCTCRLGARLCIMHVPAAAAAGVRGSSGGLASLQSCRPFAVASIASPFCRGCGQPQRRRMTTALARNAPLPGKRSSAVATAAAADHGGLPSISTIRHQTKVENLASL